MIGSLPGQIITFETRNESEQKVNKEKRYSEIKYILSKFPKGLTAKQIAVQMKKCGFTNNDDRNNAAPRLTELSQIGYVEPVGKTKCEYSGKMVSVYKLIRSQNE